MYSVFLDGFVSKLKAMQFAGAFNVYRSLRLATDTALRPGRGRGEGSFLITSALTHPSELASCVTALVDWTYTVTAVSSALT